MSCFMRDEKLLNEEENCTTTTTTNNKWKYEFGAHENVQFECLLLGNRMRSYNKKRMKNGKISLGKKNGKIIYYKNIKFSYSVIKRKFLFSEYERKLLNYFS